MNLRIIGLITAIFTMFISPFSVWLIDDGQAGELNTELEKSEIVDKTVELYISTTGEKKTMDFEEYICCVLLAEVPQSFDIEAIKAIAVAARTYTYRRMNSDEKYTVHFSADVCDDYSHCLGYLSIEDAVVRWGEEIANNYYEKIKEGVMQTKGEILYYEGTVADTVFHASSSGYTESAENIWGYEIPYLVSVTSPEEVSLTTAVFKTDEFKEILDKEGVLCEFDGDADTWVTEQMKDKNGRVESVCVGGKNITGRRMREIFGLKSTAFELTYEEGIFLFEVKGNGHGVGLSQYGCQAFASEGMAYADILSHYYSGTVLGLY